MEIKIQSNNSITTITNHCLDRVRIYGLNTTTGISISLMSIKTKDLLAALQIIDKLQKDN